MILAARGWVDAGKLGQGYGDAHVGDGGDDDAVYQGGRSPLEKGQLDTGRDTGPAITDHKGKGHDIPGVELCLGWRAPDDEGVHSAIPHARGVV